MRFEKNIQLGDMAANCCRAILRSVFGKPALRR